MVVDKNNCVRDKKKQKKTRQINKMIHVYNQAKFILFKHVSIVVRR